MIYSLKISYAKFIFISNKNYKIIKHEENKFEK